MYKPATPQNRRAEVMTTREYADGALRREEVLRVADYDLRRKAAKRDARRRLSDDRRAPAAEVHCAAQSLRALQLHRVQPLQCALRPCSAPRCAPDWWQRPLQEPLVHSGRQVCARLQALHGLRCAHDVAPRPCSMQLDEKV